MARLSGDSDAILHVSLAYQTVMLVRPGAADHRLEYPEQHAQCPTLRGVKLSRYFRFHTQLRGFESCEGRAHPTGR